MTDLQIQNYLSENNNIVPAEDGVSKIFNTSKQIIKKSYNPTSGIMTIVTPDNTFVFSWVLKKYDNGKETEK